MCKSGTIIIVDDNKGVLTAIQILLKSYFSKVVALSSPVTLTSVLREEMLEVVLLDMNFTSGINTGNEGLFWLHEIKKVRPDLPVVLFTAYADIELAIRGTDNWNNSAGISGLSLMITAFSMTCSNSRILPYHGCAVNLSFASGVNFINDWGFGTG